MYKCASVKLRSTLRIFLKATKKKDNLDLDNSLNYVDGRLIVYQIVVERKHNSQVFQYRARNLT